MRARRGVAAGAAVLLAAACQKGDAVAVKTVVTAADSADQVMFNARSLITHDGAIRAELFADTALFFDENTRIEMRGVKTHFHNREGDRNTVLTSRQGTYNTRISKMEARGDVDVVSRDGRRLQTVQLRYDQLGNQISGDSAFTLTQPGGRMLQGVGFVSDPDMRNVQVLRATQGYAGVITDKEPARGAGAAPPAGSAAAGAPAAAASPAGQPPATGAKPARPAAPAKAPAGMFTLPKSRP